MTLKLTGSNSDTTVQAIHAAPDISLMLDRRFRIPTTLALLGLLGACQPPEPPSNAKTGAGLEPARGMATPLSDGEYDALDLHAQYRTSSKLLATLYTGAPASDFYTLDSGAALKSRRDDAPTLAVIRTALGTPLSPAERQRLDREIVGDEDARDADGQVAPIEPMFRFDRNRPKQMPLARMVHFPTSRDAFTHWMAWHLANTILFSPAEEIDSADITDVQNLYRRLELSISDGRSIREIIATHQRTVENWRRFRSPEDNTREMMEIYLGRFDNDVEVPLASQACGDLYLTDERDGYKLARTDFPNVNAVNVLDQPVTNCNDFYDVVAGHPLVIPRVVSIIVDYFMAGRSSEDRLAMTQAIAATGPTTFEDVFRTLLLSRGYLLDTERPRSFEESFLSMAARLDWDFHPDVLMGMTSGRGGLSRARMDEMGWPSMSLKLGRVAGVPMDSLSLANHHKALRENLMLDSKRWRTTLGLQRPTAPTPTPPEAPSAEASARDMAKYEDKLAAYDAEVAELDVDARAAHAEALLAWNEEAALSLTVEDLKISELIDYLFLSAIQRTATAEEWGALFRLIRNEGHLDEDLGNSFARRDRLDDIAVITFDYLSRLPEAYYLPRVR